MRLTTIVFCTVPLLAVCASCASERATNEPASYQALKQDELASERDEYIEDTRERLTEVDRDIEHVKAKLEHESEFVDQNQRASWKQDLFELEQERAELGARLDRARSASPEEWEEMRGTLGSSTDALQAGVRKLRVDVAEAVGLDDDEKAPIASTAAAADSGLCRVDMSGVDADVERAGNRITVTLTTDAEKDVAELQRRASELAKTTTYEIAAKGAATQNQQKSQNTQNAQYDKDEPVEATESAAAQGGAMKSPERVNVQVAVEKVEDGAKLTFTPKTTDVESLRARLEQEAEHLEEGHCQGGQVSMQTPAR